MFRRFGKRLQETISNPLILLESKRKKDRTNKVFHILSDKFHMRFRRAANNPIQPGNIDTEKGFTRIELVVTVAQHHERFYGTGYPLGLAGDGIDLRARILSVADVVDAVSSNRPYRSGWEREKVLAYVSENSGVQFDPGVVQAFLRIAARKKDAPLTGAAWIPAAERPANPLPLDAVPPGVTPLPAYGALFSGYSEPSLRGQWKRA